MARMNANQRARHISARLDAWMPRPEIPLRHHDAFTLLVAVVLSAQCTDERVNQVTERLFALAPTPAAMAALSEAAILEVIRPCGLGPQKARALRGLARQLLERHAGQVPSRQEELEALPGVGRKTAQVVLAQAFAQPAFPVDTHIHRLARRWGLSDGRSVLQTERDLKRLFPPERWNRLHLQMIYYGRQECRARRVCDGPAHGCGLCAELNPQRPAHARGA
jgi:endonuclease-3